MYTKEYYTLTWPGSGVDSSTPSANACKTAKMSFDLTAWWSSCDGQWQVKNQIYHSLCRRQVFDKGRKLTDLNENRWRNGRSYSLFSKRSVYVGDALYAKYGRAKTGARAKIDRRSRWWWGEREVYWQEFSSSSPPLLYRYFFVFAPIFAPPEHGKSSSFAGERLLSRIFQLRCWCIMQGLERELIKPQTAIISLLPGVFFLYYHPIWLRICVGCTSLV